MTMMTKLVEGVNDNLNDDDHLRRGHPQLINVDDFWVTGRRGRSGVCRWPVGGLPGVESRRIVDQHSYHIQGEQTFDYH
jgi:hypothetical protein